MKRPFFLIALCALPILVSAQSDESQVKAMVNATRDRMARQNDVWFRDGDFLPIIQSQSVMAEVDPKDEETWSNLEWMYFNVENIGMQWWVCREFRENNPTYADAPYYEAKLFYLKKLYAKVPALLEPVIGLTPPPAPNSFRFLAHSYEKMGYYEDALRVWDKYLTLFPKDPQAKNNRSKVAKILDKK